MSFMTTLAKGLNFVDKTFGSSIASSVLPAIGSAQTFYYKNVAGSFLEDVGKEFVKGTRGKEDGGSYQPPTPDYTSGLDSSSSVKTPTFEAGRVDPRSIGMTDRVMRDARYLSKQAQNNPIYAAQISRVMPNIVKRGETITQKTAPKIGDIG